MHNAYIPAINHQGLLIRQLKQIFPNEEIHENIRSLQLSGLELDIWIPKHNLSFEFQDPHHYVATWDAQYTLDTIKTTDQIKSARVRQNGITLVVVPCWWDGAIASLISAIKFQRPDLMTLEQLELIPLNPAFQFLKVEEIPNIGEIMLASFLPYSRFVVTDHTWWAGEKYDGARYCWNPISNSGYARSGKHLQIYPSMAKLMPSIFLDCEIWFGRGLFNYVFPMYKNSEDVHWEYLRVIAFDVPISNMQTHPFEVRYRKLFSCVSDHKFIIAAPRMMCQSESTLREHVQTIIDHSGEGVILQKVASLYERGRTPNLVKLKAYMNDQEGLIVAIKDGEEASVKLTDGRIITVRAKDILVIPLPKEGDVVTFSCEAFSRKELPESPKIIRLRPDLSWEDVVLNSGFEKKQLNEQSLVFRDYRAKPMRYWNLKNMRSFMENFARKRGLDPLQASSWYSIKATDVQGTKGGRGILFKLQGYSNALSQLFPSIKFDRSQFIQSSWNIEAKRKFFERYARAKGFDPYNPDNWYKQTVRQFGAFKGGSTLFARQSFHSVLMNVFPNIGLEISKFSRQTHFQWRENRVKFFENYAHNNGFNPYDPEGWYLQSRERIMAVKGASTVIDYHDKNIRTTLLDLFPQIGLKRNQFLYFSVPHRRKHFVRIAAALGFDALVAQNWYAQDRARILSAKEVLSMLPYHNNSLATALVQLFPDINLDPAQLQHLDIS